MEDYPILLHWHREHHVGMFHLLLNRMSVCCCSEISVGLKYFGVTHRVHFFLPHRVQLLFSNGAPSCAPVYFYSEVGMLHFAAVTVSWEWVKPQKDIISDKSITYEEKAEKI